MAANGISSLSTKQLKQEGKLAIAQAKRQGYTLDAAGNVISGPDTTKPFYRARNAYDINLLPTEYINNDVVDNHKGPVTGIIPDPDVSSILNGSFTTLPPTPIPNYAIPGSDIVVNVTWGPNGASYYSPRFEIVTGGVNHVAGGTLATSDQFSVPFVDMGIDYGGDWTLWVGFTELQQGRPWISISYSVSSSSSAINEGDTVTFTISTVGVSDGTTLYWTDSGTTTAPDFTDNTSSGSFTVTSGSGTVVKTLLNDFLTEGTETVILQIRTGSTSGPVVATSNTVSVADTSIPVVDRYGFFEQQLNGGTYLSFDQTISGQRLTFICTNFNGNPTYGSYIKVNGTLVAGDQRGLAPDGVDTRLAPFQMTRGHTIIVLNPSDGSMRSGYPKVYDTYGNPGLCTTMKNDLKNVAQYDIVAIGTYDATSCTQDLRDALTNYFGDNTYSNTWSSSRISQMFLGKRNATP